MKKYSNDKNINDLVNYLLKDREWKIRRGRHSVLTAPSGRKLTVPGTPSDYRAFMNFKLDVRRLQGL
ncbi:hypothetical protein ACRN9Z_21305 [Shewanella frigidimarina]|jgi:hypothetical protein|uniref:hypothetical protein n=1 Tax=Shewanella frigidimarina TaxID=56812 RepID=UPI003D7AEADA